MQDEQHKHPVVTPRTAAANCDIVNVVDGDVILRGGGGIVVVVVAVAVNPNLFCTLNAQFDHAADDIICRVTELVITVTYI